MRRQICAANRRRVDRRRDVRLPAAPATGERGYSAWGSRGARRARGRSPPKLDLDGLAHQSRASGSRRPQSSGRGLSPGPAIAHPAAPTASERPWPSQNLPRCCSAIAPAFCGSDLLTVLLTNGHGFKSTFEFISIHFAGEGWMEKLYLKKRSKRKSSLNQTSSGRDYTFLVHSPSELACPVPGTLLLARPRIERRRDRSPCQLELFSCGFLHWDAHLGPWRTLVAI